MVAAFERQREAIQLTIASAEAQAQTALSARAACDQLITKLSSKIDPAIIEPINGWQGRYGQRGALGQAVQSIIELAYPLEITTTQIAAAIQQQFDLTFATPTERKAWVKTTIQGRLKYLVQLGVVQRIHSSSHHDGRPGRWRAAPANAYEINLAALATQAGIPLSLFTGEAMTPEDTEDDLPR